VDAPRRRGPGDPLRGTPGASTIRLPPPGAGQHRGHLAAKALGEAALRSVPHRGNRQLRRGPAGVLRGDPRNRGRADVREKLLRRSSPPGKPDALLPLLRRRARSSARDEAAAKGPDRVRPEDRRAAADARRGFPGNPRDGRGGVGGRAVGRLARGSSALARTATIRASAMASRRRRCSPSSPSRLPSP
jgi:hypothetical protein